MIACITVGSRWQPGTAQCRIRAGSGGNCGAAAICPPVSPCLPSRVKHR
jgi:hypothetical protein